jgi:hypothetical protein
LDEVKRFKEEKKNSQNQEVDEESTKIVEEEICKKVEESINTHDVK